MDNNSFSYCFPTLCHTFFFFFLPDCTGKPSSTTLDRSGDKDTNNLSCSWFSEKSFQYLTIEYVSSVLLRKLSLLLQGWESTREGMLWSEGMEGSTTQWTPQGDLAPHYPAGWPEQATLPPLSLCLLPVTGEQPHLPCSPYSFALRTKQNDCCKSIL